ncbi:MAG: DUF2029 domain-containing protein [Myxococcales bacterium]|nr:DUF2029 domain-containing protein [Myxococcales bacterium]
MSAFARRIAWAILLVRLGLFDRLEVLRAKSINDYGSFHAAAMAIRKGLDPYTPDDLQRAAHLSGLPAVHPYFYPPFLAELLQPLTHYRVLHARLLWFWITAACFVATVALLQRWVSRRNEVAGTAFVVAVCALWPLRSTNMMAQVNAVVLVLLAAWWVGRDKSPWAGVFLGAAAAIKMSPALLVLVPLTEKRFREAAVVTLSGGVLVLGSCALIGAHGMRFLGDVLLGFLPGHRYHGLRVPIDLLGNHSLGALAYWIFDRGEPWADPLKLSPKAAQFHLAAVATLLAGFALATWRGATREGRAAALVVIMILAPTFAFEHHVSFVVLPIALVVALVSRGALRSPLTWLVLPALALLTEHEASFLPPAGATPKVIAIAHMSKLVPLLVLYVAALLARDRRVYGA